MTAKDQIEALDQRLTGLEVRVDDADGQLAMLNTWLIRIKTVLAVVPSLAGMLVFMYWFFDGDSVSMAPPPVVDTVCEECLVDPLAGEWYCFDCVIVENVDGQAICVDVSIEPATAARSNIGVYRQSEAGLPAVRSVTRYLSRSY